MIVPGRSTPAAWRTVRLRRRRHRPGRPTSPNRCAFLDLLAELDIDLVSVSAGAEYNSHVMEPYVRCPWRRTARPRTRCWASSG